MKKKRRKEIIIGLDEVGRGALAGPVVAVAVKIKKNELKLKKIENYQKNILSFNDSKKFNPNKRKEIFQEIIKEPFIEWGIGLVYQKKIDKINILEATKVAMVKALKKIDYFDFKIIIDGNFKIELDCCQESLIKADEKILECSIASIIAKVKRDQIMENYHKKYPHYDFDKNKGYGTKNHIKAIKNYGLSPLHRKSFKIKS